MSETLIDSDAEVERRHRGGTLPRLRAPMARPFGVSSVDGHRPVCIPTRGGAVIRRPADRSSLRPWALGALRILGGRPDVAAPTCLLRTRWSGSSRTLTLCRLKGKAP
jgi:hypothetical protein